jgi:hypothetical protein
MAPGNFAGSISFGNNSAVDSPYNFLLGATVDSLGLQVLGNGHAIPNSDTTPNLLDNTQFGLVLQNSLQQRTFLLRNETATPINLATPTFTGPYSLVGEFPSSIDPLADVPFTINLDTSAIGTQNGSISFENGDPYKSPYNFQLGAKVEAPTPPGDKPIVAVLTKVRDPGSGNTFGAPDAALPPGWVAYQISLQTTNGELIGAVDVTIDGPLHQRWNDVDFDGATNPSPNGSASDGRGDSHLTAPVGSPFALGPEEFNSKSGSPLPSILGTTEYGLGGIAGAWGLLSPTAATNVAYIVVREDQLFQLQMTIKSADASGASFRTITQADFFILPEPSSGFLMIACLALTSMIARYRAL